MVEHEYSGLGFSTNGTTTMKIIEFTFGALFGGVIVLACSFLMICFVIGAAL